MAGIIPTFQNIGIIIASLYPIFIVSFLVLASVFNFKINGVIYLLGILITFGICYLFASLSIGNQESQATVVTCDFISTFGYNYPSPSFQAAITSFTFIYLIIPMFINKNLFNPLVLITMLVLSISNGAYLLFRKCSNAQGLLLGTLIGSLFGFLWFSIIYSANKDLVFYNELASNNIVCNMPSKQTFKCNVYKHGELISSSIA